MQLQHHRDARRVRIEYLCKSKITKHNIQALIKRARGSAFGNAGVKQRSNLNFEQLAKIFRAMIHGVPYFDPDFQLNFLKGKKFRPI